MTDRETFINAVAEWYWREQGTDRVMSRSLATWDFEDGKDPRPASDVDRKDQP